MTAFKLRFKVGDLQKWSDKYEDAALEFEKEIISNLRPIVIKNGYLDRKQFLDVCYWKTP